MNVADQILPRRICFVNPTPDELGRFWDKVSQTDGCWNWTSYLNQHGYGKFLFHGKDVFAHRFSYFIHFGEIPNSHPCVCHRCDNPACVRPDHLWIGTHTQNIQDCLAKGRHLSTTNPFGCHRGSSHSSAKLTDAQVTSIRSRYAEGSDTLQSLADEFSVHKSNIHCIVARSTWKHLPFIRQ